jgi:REP element-mobilizing transposase RayT
MSTFAALHYHFVFSTKNRLPQIRPQWQNRIHEYLGGVAKGLGGFPQIIGGVEDHVHLLVGLKTTHCISDFIRELKRSSSIWVHNEIKAQDFKWQEGYGAFTVSPNSRASVKRYISNQKEHHRKRTFREEFVDLLNKAGIEYEDKWLD